MTALTYPTILQSREALEGFNNMFCNIFNANMLWSNIDLIRELNYLQDYLTTLDIKIHNIPENKYPEIALKIKADFINEAQLLDNLIGKFFEKEIYSINTKSWKGHHKYPKEKTIKRLDATLLNKITP